MRVCAVNLMLALVVAVPSLVSGYEVVEVTDGGTLKGTVKLVGNAPKLAPIPVKKNHDLCGESVPSEALILGPGKGVRNTVVWIEGIAQGKAAGEVEALLNNEKCLFVPHVSAISTGTKTAVKNSDPVLHNVHSYQSTKTVFNLALPRKDQVIDVSRRISKLGRRKSFGPVDIRCDAHTHMQAWMVVRPDPYVSVTDDSGSFEITDIPPGTYTVVAWHESWDVKGLDDQSRPIYGEPVQVSQEVTIPAKGEAKVVFELK